MGRLIPSQLQPPAATLEPDQTWLKLHRPASSSCVSIAFERRPETRLGIEVSGQLQPPAATSEPDQTWLKLHRPASSSCVFIAFERRPETCLDIEVSGQLSPRVFYASPGWFLIEETHPFSLSLGRDIGRYGGHFNPIIADLSRSLQNDAEKI